MSPAVQAILFRGAFPVYSYMVTLRPFMRMNGVGSQEIERFVRAVVGGKLSVREIELLAHGYFRGTASLSPRFLSNLSDAFEEFPSKSLTS